MSATLTSPRRVMSDRPRSPGRRAAASRPPRRVSGPVHGRPAAARAQTAAAPRESLALGGRALALVRGLPDHSVIDRLVRGRAWIPVLGVLLAGIVAMQVEVLKLGSSMGQAMVRTTSLQTSNESLQASVAGLADDQRIERMAAGMGMTMPTPDSLVFLSAHPGGDIGRALGNIHTPDPTGFLSQMAAQAAAAAALMPAAPASTSSTGATASTTGATTSPTGATATSAGSPATSAGSTAPPTGSVTAAPTSASATQTPTTQAPATSSPGAAPSGTSTSAGAGGTSGGGAASSGAAGLASAGSSQSSGASGG